MGTPSTGSGTQPIDQSWIDASVANRERVHSLLDIIQNAACEIRGDWTDPRFETRAIATATCFIRDILDEKDKSFENIDKFIKENA